VPAEATQKFTTYADNQTAVDFNIVQGERELVQDNRLLGRFKLRGIPPMPAGLPVIRVTFSVDESGILTVTAVEERSGQKTRVEVVPAHGLSQEEVDRIIEEAYDHAEEDYRNRMLSEIRVEGDQILHATERALRSAGAMARDEERVEIEAAMERLRQAMKGTEFRAIKNAYDLLNDVSRDLAERMMNQAVGNALRDRRLDDLKQK
jgi:molecular chaperone DnaK (HSP70)